jgi:hypothetical protein
MRVHAEGKSGETQSKRIVRAVHDRSLGMADRGCPIFFTQPAAQKDAMMAHRGKCVRWCISGIKREGVFQ